MSAANAEHTADSEVRKHQLREHGIEETGRKNKMEEENKAIIECLKKEFNQANGYRPFDDPERIVYSYGFRDGVLKTARAVLRERGMSDSQIETIFQEWILC